MLNNRMFSFTIFSLKKYFNILLKVILGYGIITSPGVILISIFILLDPYSGESQFVGELDMFFIFSAFIVAICAFRNLFRFSQSFHLSRKSFWISQLLSISFFSLLLSGLSSMTTFLFEFHFPYYSTLLSHAFPSLIPLTEFSFMFLLLFGCLSLGSLIGIFIYSLNKVLTILSLLVLFFSTFLFLAFNSSNLGTLTLSTITLIVTILVLVIHSFSYLLIQKLQVN